MSQKNQVTMPELTPLVEYADDNEKAAREFALDAIRLMGVPTDQQELFARDMNRIFYGSMPTDAQGPNRAKALALKIGFQEGSTPEVKAENAAKLKKYIETAKDSLPNVANLPLESEFGKGLTPGAVAGSAPPRPTSPAPVPSPPPAPAPAPPSQPPRPDARRARARPPEIPVVGEESEGDVLDALVKEKITDARDRSKQVRTRAAAASPEVDADGARLAAAEAERRAEAERAALLRQRQPPAGTSPVRPAIPLADLLAPRDAAFRQSGSQAKANKAALDSLARAEELANANRARGASGVDLGDPNPRPTSPVPRQPGWTGVQRDQALEDALVLTGKAPAPVPQTPSGPPTRFPPGPIPRGPSSSTSPTPPPEPIEPEPASGAPGVRLVRVATKEGPPPQRNAVYVTRPRADAAGGPSPNPNSTAQPGPSARAASPSTPAGGSAPSSRPPSPPPPAAAARPSSPIRPTAFAAWGSQEPGGASDAQQPSASAPLAARTSGAGTPPEDPEVSIGRVANRPKLGVYTGRVGKETLASPPPPAPAPASPGAGRGAGVDRPVTWLHSRNPNRSNETRILEKPPDPFFRPPKVLPPLRGVGVLAAPSGPRPVSRAGDGESRPVTAAPPPNLPVVSAELDPTSEPAPRGAAGARLGRSASSATLGGGRRSASTNAGSPKRERSKSLSAVAPEGILPAAAPGAGTERRARSGSLDDPAVVGAVREIERLRPRPGSPDAPIDEAAARRNLENLSSEQRNRVLETIRKMPGLERIAEALKVWEERRNARRGATNRSDGDPEASARSLGRSPPSRPASPPTAPLNTGAGTRPGRFEWTKNMPEKLRFGTIGPMEAGQIAAFLREQTDPKVVDAVLEDIGRRQRANLDAGDPLAPILKLYGRGGSDSAKTKRGAPTGPRTELGAVVDRIANRNSTADVAIAWGAVRGVLDRENPASPKYKEAYAAISEALTNRVALGPDDNTVLEIRNAMRGYTEQGPVPRIASSSAETTGRSGPRGGGSGRGVNRSAADGRPDRGSGVPEVRTGPPSRPGTPMTVVAATPARAASLNSFLNLASASEFPYSNASTKSPASAPEIRLPGPKTSFDAKAFVNGLQDPLERRIASTVLTERGAKAERLLSDLFRNYASRNVRERAQAVIRGLEGSGNGDLANRLQSLIAPAAKDPPRKADAAAGAGGSRPSASASARSASAQSASKRDVAVGTSRRSVSVSAIPEATGPTASRPSQRGRSDAAVDATRGPETPRAAARDATSKVKDRPKARPPAPGRRAAARRRAARARAAASPAPYGYYYPVVAPYVIPFPPGAAYALTPPPPRRPSLLKRLQSFFSGGPRGAEGSFPAPAWASGAPNVTYGGWSARPGYVSLDEAYNRGTFL